MFELEVWQAPITDNRGNILPGAQITVFNSDDTVATIYDDLDREPKANPFTVGTDALARFYAEPGRYRVQAQSGTDIAVYDNVDLSQKAHRDDLASPDSEVLIAGRTAKDVSSLRDDLANPDSDSLIAGKPAKDIASLRDDLADAESEVLIAGIPARNRVISVDSIQALRDLPAAARRADVTVLVKSYYSGFSALLSGPYGGGVFKFDQSRSTDDDGALVILGWVREGKGLYTFQDFGCRCDGALDSRGYGTGVGTDDTVNAQKALDSGLPLTSNGQVLRITESLDARSCHKISNAKFDFSGGPTGGLTSGLLFFEGDESAHVTCAEVNTGDLTITLSAALDLHQGDIIFLEADDLWDLDDDLALMGEQHEVKSVDGLEITLDEPILWPMGVGENEIRVTRLDFQEDIYLFDVHAAGANVTGQEVQRGFDFFKCRNVVVDNCQLRHFNDRAVSGRRCRGFEVKGSKIGDLNRDGFSYAVVTSRGCYHVQVHHNEFFNCRHGHDAGDRFGVSRYISVHNNKMYKMREHPLSTHTACEFVDILDNQCSLADGVNAGGAIIRSISTRLNGNTLVNCKGAAACISFVANPRFPGYHEALGNHVINNQCSTLMRYISAQPVDGSTVNFGGTTGDTIGAIGIEVRASQNHHLKSARIQGSDISGSISNTGIDIRCSGGSSSIGKVWINGNNIESDGQTSSRAIRLLLQSTGGVGTAYINSNAASNGFTRGVDQNVSSGSIERTICTENDFNEIASTLSVVLNSTVEIVRDNIDASTV